MCGLTKMSKAKIARDHVCAHSHFVLEEFLKLAQMLT